MEPLEARRLAMRDQHLEHRQELDRAQRQRSEAEGQTRAARLRKGVAGLWDRLTGRRKETLRQNKAETVQCRSRDRSERHELISGQLDERRNIQREIIAVRNRYAGQAEELHRDLKRQNPSHDREEQSLSSNFNDASGASEASSAPMPRILRGRSASRSAREQSRPEL